MKKLFILAHLFLLTAIANAQTGFLSGKIISSDGLPAGNVTVSLAETPYVEVSNSTGLFYIKAPEGRYKMLVYCVGTRPIEKTVYIKDGDTTRLPDIQLTESAHSLSEVTVTGRKNKFGDKSSVYIARMPLNNMENPQSYTTIPGSLLAEQNVTSYQDAFKNISGSGVPSVATNGRVTMSSRGFKVRSMITDGVSGYTMTDIDPANIESVEVLKGPAGVLFGGGAGGGTTSFGGVVNIVTKRPYSTWGGNASYTTGSYGLNRLTFDVNTPLNTDHTILLRVNGARNDNKTMQDAGFLKSTFIAPSIYYQVNSRVSVNVDAEIFDRAATSPYWLTPYKKTTIHDARDLPVNYNLSFTNDDVYFTAQNLNIRAQVNTEISKIWRSQTSLSHTSNDLSGPQLSLNGITDSTLTRQVNAGPQNYTTLQVQQNFTGDFRIGKMRNRLLLGLDFYHYTSAENTTTLNIDTVNFIHPGANYNALNRSMLDNRLAGSSYKQTASEQQSYSAYVSDVINFTDRLNVMASLRLDRFENKGDKNVVSGVSKGRYGQTTLSPKFGVVYQPWLNKISLFANYSNGFNNVGGTDYDGHSFKPEYGNQWEGGAKLNLLHGLLVSTLSYYYIKVENTLRSDIEHNGYSVQDGTEESKGLEADITANPVAGLNIVAGYAYNQSEYLKADDGLKGTRPDGAGPKNTANLWASYKFQSGWANGIGVGFGGVYGTELDNLKSLIGFKVPAYTIVDASIFYERPAYRLGLKLNNIANEKYWNNRLQLQPLRNISASIMLKF